MKRIALICGSLEPERDGVGDYCRSLAAALRALDIDVTMLALNDRYTNEEKQGQHSLRLSASLPVKERYASARRAISEWAPDWISLQFVSWNFGWKGIIREESQFLAQLFQDRRLHFMFHETWVGGAPEVIPTLLGRVRRRVLGYLQKRSIKSFITKIQPSIFQTSNLKYQQNLAEIGVNAFLLPIFGNVPVEPGSTWDWFRTLVFSKAGLQLPEDRRDVVVIGLFGAIRPSPVEPALEQIVAAAAGRRVVLISLGAIGQNGDLTLQSWKLDKFGIESAVIGLLDTRELSHSFDQLDAALSLHPASVIGRSGAVAAFVEHGVPVICPWGQLPSHEDAFTARWSHLLYPADKSLSELFEKPPTKVHTTSVAEEVARQMLCEMRSFEAHNI